MPAVGTAAVVGAAVAVIVPIRTALLVVNVVVVAVVAVVVVVAAVVVRHILQSPPFGLKALLTASTPVVLVASQSWHRWHSLFVLQKCHVVHCNALRHVWLTAAFHVTKQRLAERLANRYFHTYTYICMHCGTISIGT